MMLNTRKKFTVATIVNVLTACVLAILPTQVFAACGASDYPCLTAQYTYGTLQALNNMPNAIAAIIDLDLKWVSPDESPTTATIQSNFGNLATAATTNATSQISLQSQLMNDYFGSTVTQATLPQANDLSYETMLGQLYFNPDPRNQNQQQNTPPVNPAYNYLKTASGMSIYHQLPNPTWNGTQYNQTQYTNFYNTVTAVQTYNSYVMSQMYVDMQNKNVYSTAESTLIQQATGSDWFTQIASENIGIVLRQILMYESQTFVMLTRMLDVQKSMLTTQSMSNTLLMLLNEQNESTLILKAQGKMQ